MPITHPRIVGLNVGHDACLALAEGGRCTRYEDLARTFRAKNLALRSGRAAARDPYWAAIVERVQAWEPDGVAAALNPGDVEEFAAQLACLAYVPGFEDAHAASARAWQALREQGWYQLGARSYLVEHGLAHVGSAWLTSPFERDAPVLGVALDGWSTFGHDTVTTLANGEPGPLRRGVFGVGGSFFDQYLATIFFGAPSLAAPGKLMGFAQHGRERARYREYLETAGARALSAAPTFRRQCAQLHAWARDTQAAFPELARDDAAYEQRPDVQDFIATAQEFFTASVTETMVALANEMSIEGIVYAGGCALSIVTNDRLADALRVPLHIVPCANDSGQALGAALWLDRRLGGSASPAGRFDPFLGLQAGGDREPAQPVPLDVDDLAEQLAVGALIGWFRGRHAVGPRALGDRSLLASPAIPGMRDRLNREVKQREWYRPYGAICLESEVDEIFEGGRPSPYMLFSFRVRDAFRDVVGECCSHNGRCRIQTVNESTHPDLCALLRAFRERTGCPLLINTSLNRGGLPIVSSIEHAVEDAAAMRLDGVVWVAADGRDATILRASG